MIAVKTAGLYKLIQVAGYKKNILFACEIYEKNENSKHNSNFSLLSCLSQATSLLISLTGNLD